MTTATLTRELRFEPPAAAIAPDALLPCTIATSAPVVRFGAAEVLDCSPAGVDLSRAPLPLIVTHNANALAIGLVENLKATGDRVTVKSDSAPALKRSKSAPTCWPVSTAPCLSAMRCWTRARPSKAVPSIAGSRTKFRLFLCRQTPPQAFSVHSRASP